MQTEEHVSRGSDGEPRWVAAHVFNKHCSCDACKASVERDSKHASWALCAIIVIAFFMGGFGICASSQRTQTTNEQMDDCFSSQTNRCP